MINIEDTPQWRGSLLPKIGAYGVSDPRLMDIAAAICSKQPLSEAQQLYAREFEARLEDSHALDSGFGLLQGVGHPRA